MANFEDQLYDYKLFCFNGEPYCVYVAQDFPFVRVDFFDTDEHLYVAELTFTPGGGCVPYNPIEFNQELGNLLRIPLQ